MPGGTKKKPKKMQEFVEQQDFEQDEAHANTDEEDGDSEAATTQALHETMLTISKQISGLRTELKSDLDAFKADIKQEMNTLKHDINQQLTATKLAVQEQSGKLEEAQKRIEGMETWSAAANDALRQSLTEQRKMIDKINDLESRGKRNNLRIYGVLEGEEGSSTITFVEKLLRSEKLIDEGTDPQIQRAHRSLGPRPGPHAPPRSIIVNFLEFKIKETVLRNAWRKKIFIRDKLIAFDNDYTAAVVQQRRAYKHVKSALKAKGIRFQSPFTKLRIHWETGPQLYHSPAEAAREMKQKGIAVEELQEQRELNSAALLDQLENASPWQLVPRHSDRGAIQRVRERLQEFQRNPC